MHQQIIKNVHAQTEKNVNQLGQLVNKINNLVAKNTIDVEVSSKKKKQNKKGKQKQR